MNVLTLVRNCPEWCNMKHVEDNADRTHYGPKWESKPMSGNPISVQIMAFANEKGLIKINVETPSIDLTGEQAIQAGQYLVEAGQWALAHSVK